jgi:bifunctional DNA-binding transcriptional regulator/antitoxin component of YhaV-PrlF toxin-antitoxin module
LGKNRISELETPASCLVNSRVEAVQLREAAREFSELTASRRRKEVFDLHDSRLVEQFLDVRQIQKVGQIPIKSLIENALLQKMRNPANAHTVSFNVKGQVVIPRTIRDGFEIEKATRAIVETTAEGILLKPITGKYIRSLRGKYKHLDLMKGLKEGRRETRRRDW